MTTLLAFYYGSHPDDRGRFLAEIVKQDDIWLEIAHDYIQWLFPLTEHSRVNPSAPILTRTDIAAFRQDELLQTHMRAALARMLRFYGLTQRAGAVTKAGNWNERKDNWFTEPTHNNLRITRILKSMSILGLQQDAHAFLSVLETLVATEPHCGIPVQSLNFWRTAVTMPTTPNAT